MTAGAGSDAAPHRRKAAPDREIRAVVVHTRDALSERRGVSFRTSPGRLVGRLKRLRVPQLPC